MVAGQTLKICTPRVWIRFDVIPTLLHQSTFNAITTPIGYYSLNEYMCLAWQKDILRRLYWQHSSSYASYVCLLVTSQWSSVKLSWHTVSPVIAGQRWLKTMRPSATTLKLFGNAFSHRFIMGDSWLVSTLDIHVVPGDVKPHRKRFCTTSYYSKKLVGKDSKHLCHQQWHLTPRKDVVERVPSSHSLEVGKRSSGLNWWHKLHTPMVLQALWKLYAHDPCSEYLLSHQRQGLTSMVVGHVRSWHHTETQPPH